MMTIVWHGGATIGAIYEFKTDGDCQRVGSCWMAGRVKVGDYALCLKHSGDCFYDYILVQRYVNGWRGIPGSKFGAYFFGAPVVDKLSDREFHLLAAGEFVGRPEESFNTKVLTPAEVSVS